MPSSKARTYETYLVLSAKLGDGEAAEKLVVLRGPKLLAHAVRLLGDRDEAKDVVQDAWAEIFTGLPKLREEAAFPAWSHRIVTRRVAKVIGSSVARRELAVSMAEQPEHYDEGDGESVADAQSVRRAIETLPPEHRATISLFYLEEMSVAEVAIALDVPPGTIKTRLMHARTKLAKTMKGKLDE